MTTAEGYLCFLSPAKVAASGRVTQWNVRIDQHDLRATYTLKDALVMIKAYIEKREIERAQERLP